MSLIFNVVKANSQGMWYKLIKYLNIRLANVCFALSLLSSVQFGRMHEDRKLSNACH
jgi:hypothetical protein